MSGSTPRDGAGALGSARPRLQRLDWILIGTLGPLALLCFALHVHAVLSGTLLYPAFYVSPAQTATDAPTVAGFLSEFENAGELRVGDRILRVGDVDTRGAGPLRVATLMYGQAQDGIVPMEIEREGVRQRIERSLVGLDVPWFRIPLLLGLATIAILVLLRSPGSPSTRLMFVAFMNSVIFESLFTGPSVLQFHAGLFTFHVWGVLALMTLGVWVTRFPPDLEPRHRVRWGFALLPGLWILPRLAQYLGGPLPNHSLSAQFFVVDLVLALWFLTVLRQNYLHSDAVGRRRVKWVLLGAYMGILPFAFVTLLAALYPDLAGLRLLHAWGVGCVALAPAGVFVAIARYNLFDIDRLISGAASYTLVLVLAAVGFEVLLEPFAGLLGERLGFDASSSQLVFVGLMAGVMLPFQRAWRPFVDRVFFADARSQIDDIELLLEELPGVASQGADALLSLVGARLAAVFDPTFCIVYRLDGTAFAPAFGMGEERSMALSDESTRAVTRMLGRRIGPMRLDRRGRSREDPEVAQAVRTALQLPDASLLVPLRPRGALEVFFCLGPKQSGDVYTPTDLTLLASVAHHVAEDLPLDVG